MMALEQIRAILDVDTGVDDAMAIALAVAAPTIDLVAVTTVAGNVELEHTTRNTLRVLDFVGARHIPVYRGMSRPMDRPLHTASHVHGSDGLGGADIPESSRSIESLSAPQYLIDAARRSPGELTFIFVGPLTNLAVALLREPNLPQLLKGWTLMGGAYRHPGNTAPTTEWNIHCDPEAAKIAFAAWGDSAVAHGHGRPIALGLDVTEQAKILPEHVVALARAAGSSPDDSLALARGEDPMVATRSVASNPIVRYVADALRFYMEFHAHYDGFYGAFIHDPLAVAAALDPALVRTQAVTVDVELGGTLTTGETVTDWRGVWGRPPNVDVAIEADAPEFLRRLVERVGRLAAARPT
ncbi:MAG: purine nucleosidase [Chloroflexota bacterium]|nr:purine nucleosidase [Chloroflexota bacterium]